eukprot:2015995-Rhodomonas_salina.3
MYAAAAELDWVRVLRTKDTIRKAEAEEDGVLVWILDGLSDVVKIPLGVKMLKDDKGAKMDSYSTKNTARVDGRWLSGGRGTWEQARHFAYYKCWEW